MVMFLEANGNTDNELKQALNDVRMARNNIAHSADDFSSLASFGDITVKALLKMRPYIIDLCGADNFEVITYDKLEERRIELHEKASEQLKEQLEKHHLFFSGLSREEVNRRINSKKVFSSQDVFVSNEKPSNCPACMQNALDEITIVDFERGDGGELCTYASIYYECRVCEIVLNQHDLELVGDEVN
jgi:hypothetical protein